MILRSILITVLYFSFSRVKKYDNFYLTRSAATSSSWFRMNRNCLTSLLHVRPGFKNFHTKTFCHITLSFTENIEMLITPRIGNKPTTKGKFPLSVIIQLINYDKILYNIILIFLLMFKIYFYSSLTLQVPSENWNLEWTGFSSVSL